ncbi:unnamed protein product [Penicillium palitans]
MSCVARVAVNNTDQGLTTHELEAIKGRIIQAVYDGNSLALQHSQLWTFEEPQTAPVEMFVLYYLSQPVGLEKSTLCVR